MIRTFLYVLGGVVALVIVAGVSYFVGDKQALGSMNFELISADQAAQAMSNDNFYGLYRNKTLVVSGVVSSVEQQGLDTIVEFKTNLVSKAYCDLGSAQTAAKPGDSIRVLAEGFASARTASGVVLKPCVAL